jgi:hypothetical protein
MPAIFTEQTTTPEVEMQMLHLRHRMRISKRSLTAETSSRGGDGLKMNWTTLHFPRKLETDVSAEKIRETLATRKIKLLPEDAWEVPCLTWTPSLEKAIRKANLQRRVRLGLEEIAAKLAAEKKGLEALERKTADSGRDRISRLLLFTDDGAQRFYRNIAGTLTQHAPRLLGCMVMTQGPTLGRVITGKPRAVKVILIEHKDAVADILHSIL